ncbi:hypothetical protein ABPG75_003017 [Micractinium tetrahymenae]
MAARRHPAGPGLEDLPVSVLAACLAHLPAKERLTDVCLASKDLHAVCHSPELLREVRVKLRGPNFAVWGQTLLLQARSLAAWLRRHGGHVRSLQLLLRPWGSESQEDRHGIALAVLDCLAACTELQRLRIEAGGGAASGSAPGVQLRGLLFAATWKLPGLRQHLQHASLYGGRWDWSSPSDDALPKGIQRLSSLQSLQLDQMTLPPGVRLPPSLTRLDLSRLYTPKRLPPELASLPALRRLWLWDVHLQDALLPAMEGLTRLDLWGATPLPPNLASLPHLSWLGFVAYRYPFEEWEARDPLFCIPGLPSLRHLSTLRICTCADWAVEEDWAAFAAWAGAHPALRRLRFLLRGSSSEGPDELHAKIGSLRQRCPALDIEQVVAQPWQDYWEVPGDE